MEMNSKVLLYAFMFVASAALCSAKIGHMDDYWRKKLEAANAISKANYHPESMHVVRELNEAVHTATDSYQNSTRRSLLHKKFNGGCKATNPIDRCWRCQWNWALNRKHYASCVKGFGRHTTGGLAGHYYVVIDPRDDQLVEPRFGTLRWGVTRDRPLWIVFAYNMHIQLQQELIINSDKTIDGRGVNVHITGGAGFNLQGVHNVIITNIHIHDIKSKSGGLIRDSEEHYGIRTASDGDGISIITSSNIWIDHVSISQCADGAIDAVANSTAITISNCHFTHHDHVMLLGASNENTGDKIMQVTIAFNHFGKGLTQRMPRVRYGFVHVLNNDYTCWTMYAIGGSQNPTILTQGNRFIAQDMLSTKEVTKREAQPSEWKNWNWRSENNYFVNGAYFVEGGKPIHQTYGKANVIKAKPGTYARRLTRFAGPLPCRIGKPC